ncbi:MAG: sigma 54-interacting transcriptional regulator [Kofleriaceae bacterium]
MRHRDKTLTIRGYEGTTKTLQLECAELVVKDGPDKGEKRALGAETLSIGSGNDVDLVLHDHKVSKRHAEIVATPQGYIYSDLDSTNGTWLDRYRISEVYLSDGMVLLLGDSKLVIRARGERQSIPLSTHDRFGGLVTCSPKTRAVAAMLGAVAPTEATILLEGETGSGKEVAAQAVHEASSRCEGPFVVFDCGMISPSLAAAELFGHERGAFTGAHESRPGLLEQTTGGTLFLDEVGELPLDQQPLLLRLLETRSGRRVGGTTDMKYDVRIIAATNRNLSEEVKQGRFRQDLYYRLAVVRVRIPPLRERPEDLEVLARQFADELGKQLTPELLSMFALHHWPGNIRELRNIVHRIGSIDRSALITKRHQKPRWAPIWNGDELRRISEGRRMAVEEFEARYLEDASAVTGGNMARASKLAGVSPQFLNRLAAKYGIGGRKKPTEP